MPTMEIHHTKHHQTTIDTLNAALKGHDAQAAMTAEQLIRNLNAVPEAIRTAVRNHGGGHANHGFFRPILGKGVNAAGPEAVAITARFLWNGFRTGPARAAGR
jgi:Fe-Mn family superoxide dismutase